MFHFSKNRTKYTNTMSGQNMNAKMDGTCIETTEF
jgi:hypothetical protein